MKYFGMGYGVMNEIMDKVKNLWVWQSKIYNVGLYNVADTQSIIQNQTNGASQSWNWYISGL
jgi:hypothetical protein